MNTKDQDALTDMLAKMIRTHNLAVDELTNNQFAEALRQALPDFRRLVHANKQQVIYLPGQEAAY